MSPRVLGFQVGDIGARRVIGPETHADAQLVRRTMLVELVYLASFAESWALYSEMSVN